MVEAVAVVVKTGFGIEVLCREAMPEEVGKRAGLGDEFSEGIVCVLRNSIAVLVKVARDIADVVVERNIDRAVNREVEKPTDATCALQRSGNVFAPVVTDRRRRAVRVGDALFYEVPVIVEEGCSRFWRDLLDAAGLGIIEISQSEDAVGRDCFQAARSIVCKCAGSICQKISIKVVCEFSVLVDVVWREEGRIADFVVAVAIGDAAYRRRGHLAAGIVAEGVGVAGSRAVERIVCIGEAFNNIVVGRAFDSCH